MMRREMKMRRMKTRRMKMRGDMRRRINEEKNEEEI